MLLNYDYGLKQQGDMFFVTEETAKNKADMLNRFLRATAKGWEYALNNPEEAAKITVEKYAPDLKLEETTATIQATKPLTMTDRAVKAGLMSLDEDAWKQTIGELIPGRDAPGRLLDGRHPRRHDLQEVIPTGYRTVSPFAAVRVDSASRTSRRGVRSRCGSMRRAGSTRGRQASSCSTVGRVVRFSETHVDRASTFS